jgi:N-acetylmuramoyl-L-alanine amidase
MPKIMLDAGHYGKQNRSPVVPEYWESEMTWKLQNYLKIELEKYGFTVGTTRTDQTKDLEVTQRGRKAKGYDLFISLHSNACGTESVDRVVGIYFVPDNRTTVDEKSKDIAERLAKCVAEYMPVKGGYQCYSRLSEDDRDRNGKKDDNYYGVLHGSRAVNVPGVIIEHSFHTNKAATLWLLNDTNLKGMAEREAAVLADYYGLKLPDIPGDLNGDGKVNSVDAFILKKAILGNVTLTDEQRKKADLNGDGKLNSIDYMKLKKNILKQ